MRSNAQFGAMCPSAGSKVKYFPVFVPFAPCKAGEKHVIAARSLLGTSWGLNGGPVKQCN
jgi:hypothetical protein